MPHGNTDMFGHPQTATPTIKGEKYAGIITAETHAAIQFFTGDHRIWLPKSRIYIDETLGPGRKALDRDAIVTIPDWLAREKQLIQ